MAKTVVSLSHALFGLFSRLACAAGLPAVRPVPLCRALGDVSDDDTVYAPAENWDEDQNSVMGDYKLCGNSSGAT